MFSQKTEVANNTELSFHRRYLPSCVSILLPLVVVVISGLVVFSADFIDPMGEPVLIQATVLAVVDADGDDKNSRMVMLRLPEAGQVMAASEVANAGEQVTVFVFTRRFTRRTVYMLATPK